VGEVSSTEITLAETADASGLLANAFTVLANVWPFCSRSTRLLFGVDELKNASQLVLIAASAEAELLPAGELAALVAGAAGVDEVGVELGELLLEQAVIATASARPNAGARKIRRAMWWNRILRLPRSRSDAYWYDQFL
jgi:hypothetical protein